MGPPSVLLSCEITSYEAAQREGSLYKTQFEHDVRWNSVYSSSRSRKENYAKFIQCCAVLADIAVCVHCSNSVSSVPCMAKKKLC